MPRPAVAAGQGIERFPTDPMVPREEPLEGLERPGALAERLLAEVDRAAVVRGKQQKANRLRTVPGEQVLERLGTGRLRDLGGCLRGRLGGGIVGPSLGATRPAADLPGGTRCLHQAVVHPVGGHRAVVERFALGDFVLMVREDQVQPATVDIEVLAEDRPAHRRALDVPARPARAPRALPRRLARLGLLPEREVGRRPLPLGG